MSEPSLLAPTAPPRRLSPRLSHPVSFAAVAAISVLFLAASSAPSPLYVVYQAKWHFSATTLTVVFAIYVLGLIASLLVLGALSDYLGRRPVLAAAIALEAAALVAFAFAGNVAVLCLARVLQGIATGMAMSTLSATLVDLNPPHAPGRAGLINGVAPTSGLALGALGCGALVQYAPSPTQLVWLLLLGGMVLAALAVWRIPETSASRAGVAASLKPRVGVPERLRPDFYSLVPILIASWALGGLYLSLGASVAAGIFGLTNHLIGGLVVTLLCGTGALTALVLRKRPVAMVLRIGAVLLAAGTGATLAGVLNDTVALAIVGTVLSGIGFGASALASFATLARISGPSERGEVFSAAYIVAYTAFSVPAVIAGFAATSAGLRDTSVVYSSAVIALGVAALAAQQLRSRKLS
ncbi:MFS transporter [Streptomyces sp. NPDC051954]|uniref:MFS transporter n=1 Tax=unclassified Streptomyces TaxID=2593676 RepID=UPI0034460506